MRFSQISTFLAAAGLFIFAAANSQVQGLYVKASAGYNLGLGPENGSNRSISRIQNSRIFRYWWLKKPNGLK